MAVSSGIYKHMLSDKKFGLTHNLIATKVMPPLIPHTVNPGLSMEKVTLDGQMELNIPTSCTRNL